MRKTETRVLLQDEHKPHGVSMSRSGSGPISVMSSSFYSVVLIWISSRSRNIFLLRQTVNMSLWYVRTKAVSLILFVSGKFALHCNF